MTLMKTSSGSTYPSEAPHVDKEAKPRKWKDVAKGRNVIDVVNASIRNAVVSGKFAVADSKSQNTIVNGKRTVEVECLWYDWKPKNRWIRLILSNNEQIYATQEDTVVVANISN